MLFYGAVINFTILLLNVEASVQSNEKTIKMKYEDAELKGTMRFNWKNVMAIITLIKRASKKVYTINSSYMCIKSTNLLNNQRFLTLQMRLAEINTKFIQCSEELLKQTKRLDAEERGYFPEASYAYGKFSLQFRDFVINCMEFNDNCITEAKNISTRILNDLISCDKINNLTYRDIQKNLIEVFDYLRGRLTGIMLILGGQLIKYDR